MNGFTLDYGPLLRGARGHDALADEARSARRAVDGARLPDGSLGKLPQAQEIAATFEAQYQAVEAGLAGLVRAFGQIHQGLLLTVETYHDGDERVANVFRTGDA
jgi:hypothetical protein